MRRCSQITYSYAFGVHAQCIGQLGVVGSASGVQRMKAQAALESVPGFFIELRAQSWFDALLQQFKIAFLAHGGAAQSKNAAVLVQSASPVGLVERGYELAQRQVAGASETDAVKGGGSGHGRLLLNQSDAVRPDRQSGGVGKREYAR